MMVSLGWHIVCGKKWFISLLLLLAWYSYSYIISKQFIESAKLNNPTLKYYIDIHRDSQPASITTIDIEGKS